ncbi:MAG: Deoxyhypusine synthase [Candidatus Ozemobacter sibiricus]|jgi:deoxyhypusine synthase|uniref:Deoxyhypusine synthase n=1 Tax=Candidatus Ozemobacter sibiricus TaxID=2268124 RepID=A0A367ZJF7_9BACT|nr:MAG: Deoxyhypusine synthase [Candidatus Ozemobacter sibiricus]
MKKSAARPAAARAAGSTTNRLPPRRPAPKRAVNPYLSGAPIDPAGVTKGMTVPELISSAFVAYNAGRLREACRLYTEKMLRPDVTIGLSLAGALTPAGLGKSVIIPLIKAGFVDWIVSTGANLYHDTHFGIGEKLYAGSPFFSDLDLRKKGVVRIYDVVFEYDVLLNTDAFFRQIMRGPEFQRAMGTAEFHHLCGKYIRERERQLKLRDQSLLAAAYEAGVPVFTSSPGDSSIGMNIAALALDGGKLTLDPNLDVNQTAAIVLNAKRSGGKSAVFICGGGSPKNFMLQTEPQIQEVLGIEEEGHDYFLQFTDARPDTGGLSGATPSEAVSWGKVRPDSLPDTVVCYLDSTVALPLLAAYALSTVKPRRPRRLYDKLPALVDNLREEYHQARRRTGRR